MKAEKEEIWEGKAYMRVRNKLFLSHFMEIETIESKALTHTIKMYES